MVLHRYLVFSVSPPSRAEWHTDSSVCVAGLVCYISCEPGLSVARSSYNRWSLMIFRTGVGKPEKSRRADRSLSRHDERRLDVRSRRGGIESNQRAYQDHHAYNSTGDGVRVLHHRICQAKQLWSVATGLMVITIDFRIQRFGRQNTRSLISIQGSLITRTSFGN